MGRLQDKVVVVTGAGSGMGRAMASLFTKEGAKVVAAEWNQGTLDEVVAEVKAWGGRIAGVQADVSKPEDAAKIVRAALDAYGRIDVLCNNAGIMDNFAATADVDDATLARVMGVNAYGPLYLSRAAIPIMLSQGKGTIVNTASLAGIGGGAAGTVYTMSKHACIGLTRSTAWMYAKKGIRCNAMAVGGVATGIMANTAGKVAAIEAKGLGATRAGEWAALAPGFGEPMDVANLALYLASDESKFVNGAVIAIDAGWSCP